MPTIKELHINGARRSIDADARRTLLSVLRDDMDLTGSKYGCGEGRCGACTVLIDGRPVRSCNTLVGAVGGKKIQTIEGVASGDKLALERILMKLTRASNYALQALAYLVDQPADKSMASHVVAAAQGAAPGCPKPSLEDAIAATAVTPTAIAAFHRHARGESPVEPRDDLGHATIVEGRHHGSSGANPRLGQRAGVSQARSQI